MTSQEHECIDREAVTQLRRWDALAAWVLVLMVTVMIACLLAIAESGDLTQRGVM